MWNFFKCSPSRAGLIDFMNELATWATQNTISDCYNLIKKLKCIGKKPKQSYEGLSKSLLGN